MTNALRRIAALSGLVAMLGAMSPTAFAAAPKVAGKPAAASPAIIALPLQPVVPAAQRLCTLKTASGLGYTVLKAATGAKPGRTDYTLISYIGYLAATGAVFDQNQTTPLSVENVIPGFSEGLQMMNQGSIVRLCIPAAQGYGAQASGPIPANSDLVFQIELLDFKTTAEIGKMQAEAAAKAEAEAKPETAAAAKPM